MLNSTANRCSIGRTGIICSCCLVPVTRTSCSVLYCWKRKASLKWPLVVDPVLRILSIRVISRTCPSSKSKFEPKTLCVEQRCFWGVSYSTLRKQLTFDEVATWAVAKRRLSNERRNSILMTCLYPDLGSASDWLKEIPTNQKHYQDWVETCHQYGIPALLTQTSFCEVLSGDLVKRRLFSQASPTPVLLFPVLNKSKKDGVDENNFFNPNPNPNPHYELSKYDLCSPRVSQ